MEPQTEVLVTPETYPAIFRAFRMIDYDNGVVNRHAPESIVYGIPAYCAKRLPQYEATLARLTDHEFATFCIGAEDEMLALTQASPDLEEVSAFLNEYFGGWDED